ncbi:MAG TPA: hypothetical protein VMR70_20880 [Flavisolibacter sp.]|nr:hypothetical protein [Flavisolibacter sp.]
MKLSDFILLSEQEKRHAVLNQGVLIAKRKTASQTTFLFGVESFYVEACFDSVNKHIEEFRMFDSARLPQLYLDQIGLDDLLN